MTPEHMQNGITRLQKRVEQVRSLATLSVRFDDPKVSALRNTIVNTIKEVFGDKSSEARQNPSFRILYKGNITANQPDSVSQRNYIAGLDDTIIRLESLIHQLNEKLELSGGSGAGAKRIASTSADSKKVFVIHGHNNEMKERVKSLLLQLKLAPVILHEQTNQGRTIIEKFEQHAEGAEFAVALLSPDDTVITKEEGQSLRARQNVIYEMGFFHGSLGRGKVCALYAEGVALPSDYDGVLYIPFKGDDWKLHLAREMRDSGLSIDFNLL